jgi:hypothetical protein
MNIQPVIWDAHRSRLESHHADRCSDYLPATCANRGCYRSPRCLRIWRSESNLLFLAGETAQTHFSGSRAEHPITDSYEHVSRTGQVGSRSGGSPSDTTGTLDFGYSAEHYMVDCGKFESRRCKPMLFQYFISYNLRKGWYLTGQPTITYHGELGGFERQSLARTFRRRRGKDHATGLSAK